MKLTIGKGQLLSGLQAVQNIVGSRTTLPILSNVLLRADEKGLEFTATDLDVTISCTVEAKVSRPGATTLPVKRLFSIARELGSLEVEMDVNDKNECAICGGPSYFLVRGLGAEEFPPTLKPLGHKSIVLAQEKLKGMLRKTSFAVSNDEARYVLNGLFFSVKDHKVTMVATDGRRLAMVDEDADVDPAAEGDMIVPSKAVAEISRLLGEQGDVEIASGENQIWLQLRAEKAPGIQIVSKLVDGTYPNYRQVIPPSSRERVPLMREEFEQALRRAEIMTSEKANSVKLSFGRDTLAITANSPDVGEAREALAINYKGNEFAVAFNPVFLLDGLRALDNDEVFFELTDELSPGVLKINGPFLYVIMPMRMN